jgi:hypothetical protein
MAVTKTLRTIITAATSNAASATTTGTAFNLTTAFGALLTAKITNGGTGPTIAASVKVYTSADNANFKLFQTVTGDTTASSVNEWAFDIPATVMYVRADVTGNTVQAVTCEAFLQELTTV